MSEEEPESGVQEGALQTIEKGKEWLDAARSGTKPWRDFVAVSKMSKPRSVGDASRRLMTNVKRFKSNYLFVFVGLAVYCM